jgi:hypothetical protein
VHKLIRVIVSLGSPKIERYRHTLVLTVEGTVTASAAERVGLGMAFTERGGTYTKV